MATIGTFKKSGTEYTGEIVTLSVQAKAVRIVHRDAEKGRRDRERRALSDLQRLLQELNATSSSGGGGEDGDKGGEDSDDEDKEKAGLGGPDADESS
ncbi:MAG: hypothetical protein AAF317_16275, partial [Pseudomonadota bacterium]